MRRIELLQQQRYDMSTAAAADNDDNNIAIYNAHKVSKLNLRRRAKSESDENDA